MEQDFNEQLTMVPLCEVDDCLSEAVLEWCWVDEDEEFYYTDRCELHPVKDPKYVGRNI